MKDNIRKFQKRQKSESEPESERDLVDELADMEARHGAASHVNDQLRAKILELEEKRDNLRHRDEAIEHALHALLAIVGKWR